MTDVRTIPASARLHSAIVEQRITLLDDPELAKRAADAIAKHSGAAGGSTSPPSAPTSTG